MWNKYDNNIGFFVINDFKYKNIILIIINEIKFKYSICLLWVIFI